MISLPAGTRLDDRFELRECLGAGAFGAVYRARQLVFGQPLRNVALKLFSTHVVSPETVRDVFHDAIILVSLQEEHPAPEVSRHLVEIHDFGVVAKPEKMAFMSMSLVPGGKTLRHAVHRWSTEGGKGMPVKLSMEFMLQLLVPLAWMHGLSEPVIHGDLKPDNILLTGDSTLVVTDFGLSAPASVGVLGGTLPYLPHEALRGNRLSFFGDVYALGLIWYEMLTGKNPFCDVGSDLPAAKPGEDKRVRHKLEIAAQIKAREWQIRPARNVPGVLDLDRVPPASELNPDLRDYPQAERILTQCLEYKQSERFSSAGFLRAEIEKCYGNYFGGERMDPEKPLGRASGGKAPVPLSRPPAVASGTVAPSAAATPDLLAADAEAQLKQGRPTEALATAERALGLDSRCRRALLARVRALAGLTLFSEAEQRIAEMLIRDGSPRGDVLAARADVWEAMKKPDTLVKSLRDQAARLQHT